MARKATNNILHRAKSSKSDEFYTLLEDIEKELIFYKDCFHGKTVYCNCDNPKESNFFKYFFQNFKTLGLKKLIASYYIPCTQNLFSDSTPEHGGYIECSLDDINLGFNNLNIKILNGDGDFRSHECISLIKQAFRRVICDSFDVPIEKDYLLSILLRNPFFRINVRTK